MLNNQTTEHLGNKVLEKNENKNIVHVVYINFHNLMTLFCYFAALKGIKNKFHCKLFDCFKSLINLAQRKVNAKSQSKHLYLHSAYTPSTE